MLFLYIHFHLSISFPHCLFLFTGPTNWLEEFNLFYACCLGRQHLRNLLPVPSVLCSILMKFSQEFIVNQTNVTQINDTTRRVQWSNGNDKFSNKYYVHIRRETRQAARKPKIIKHIKSQHCHHQYMYLEPTNYKIVQKARKVIRCS